MTDIPISVGVVRPTRPAAPIAEAEARVIRAELARRLGSVVCDLRVDGAPVGSWASRSTAAWPADLDVELEPELLWNDRLPPLTALFGRTVDSTAAEVRARMLRHLGIGGEPLDDTVFDDDVPWRPTDLWLLARRDGVDADASRDLAGLADSGALQAALDEAFDQAAASVRARMSAERTQVEVARLRARVAELDEQLAGAVDDADRRESEAADRIAQLEAERSVLTETALRTTLDSSGSDRSQTRRR